MRVNKDLIEDIANATYLRNCKVDIIKHYDDQLIHITQSINNEMCRLSECNYLMQVIMSAYDEYNDLYMTWGLYMGNFTIDLHMNICKFYNDRGIK